MAAIKKGAAVKVKNPRTKSTHSGKFVGVRDLGAGKGGGEFYEVEIDGKIKNFRPSQVAVA